MTTTPKMWDKIIGLLEKGWCKHDLYQDANGVYTIKAKAKRVCLMGAVEKALPINRETNDYYQYIREAMVKLHPQCDTTSIPDFNDHRLTTQKEVVKVAKLAKKLALKGK